MLSIKNVWILAREHVAANTGALFESWTASNSADRTTTVQAKLVFAFITEWKFARARAGN
jgi:hypothetical protein